MRIFIGIVTVVFQPSYPTADKLGRELPCTREVDS